MRRVLGAAALLAALAAPLPACAQVTVRFVAPERYTDAENRFGSGPPLRVTLAEMRRLFENLGGRVLAPGQSLDIDVLDIDLAGFDQPGPTRRSACASSTTSPRRASASATPCARAAAPCWRGRRRSPTSTS